MKLVGSKSATPPLPTVYYAADRSKAVVLVLFLFLCGFVVLTTGCFMLSHALLFVLMLLLLFFQSYLALWSPRLGKGEMVYMLPVLLFVYFARVKCCPFSLPLGVSGWLRLVLATLPGLFYLLCLRVVHERFEPVRIQW